MSPRHYLLFKIMKEIMVIIAYVVIPLCDYFTVSINPLQASASLQKTFDFLMLSGRIKSNTRLSMYLLTRYQQKGAFLFND